MKIRPLSDMHLEFLDYEFDLPSVGEDVIVLAGDIGVGLKGLEWAEQFTGDRQVIYVPGNHEYYSHAIEHLGFEFGTASRNVEILDNATVDIEHVRFIGSTLWTDFELYGNPGWYMEYAQSHMTDFKVITHQGCQLLAYETAEFYQQGKDFLREEVQRAVTDGMVPVVITHHGVSHCSVAQRFLGNELTPAFVSDVEDLMGNHIPLWIHGHVHDAVDKWLNGTRIVCNPMGYPRELPTDRGFDLRKVIEI